MTCCDVPNGYLPNQATAGLPFQAAVTLADYPAPRWSATLHLRGPKAIDLTAAGDGATHTFSASATTTGAWADGQYWYSLRVTDGADVREIEHGELRVLPDLVAAGDGYDGRSKWQIGLDAIDAVLEKRASQDQQRYVINNRELWRTPIADLLKLRAYYATKVRQECKGGRRGFGRQIPVRFS